MIKTRGVTIIELLFVLVIIAVLALAGIKRFQTGKQTRDLEQLQQAVQSLQQATTDYYYQACANSTTACDIDLRKLAEQGLLPNPRLLSTPWSSKAFTVGAEVIEVSDSPSYRLWVAIDLDLIKPEQLNWYAARLKADITHGDGSGLKWIWLPSTSLPGSSSYFATSNAALAVFTRFMSG